MQVILWSVDVIFYGVVFCLTLKYVFFVLYHYAYSVLYYYFKTNYNYQLIGSYDIL